MRVSDPAEGFVVRLDEVLERLALLAQMDSPGRLTDPDPDTGERWGWAHVWSHMVEFMPYWRGQIDRIREAGSSEPVPFGRIKTDPERIARIAGGLGVPLPELGDGVREEIGHLKAFLADLTEEDWLRAGRHQTKGVMPMDRIVDEFLVGHLEEHAAQLESLSGRSAPPGSSTR